MQSKRVAIIGAGPGGFYAALELLKHFSGQIDIIDRLPTPFGLVRYGIAPDNQRMKSVSKVFSGLIDQFDNLRFIGNVDFGSDLHRDDLLRHYDAIIYATGAAGRQYLRVPGEDLAGSFSAMDFVDWYNGHPLRRISDFSMAFSKAAVVGGGNVALDVVRMLINEMDVVRSTDVPDRVLRELERNAVREVYLLVRKGPAQVKFTPVELRGLVNLKNVDIVIDPEDLKLTQDESDYVDADQQCRLNMNILKTIAERPQAGYEKKIHVKFWRSVASIGGNGSVEWLDLRSNKAPSDASPSAGSGNSPCRVSVDAIFSAIGNVVGAVSGVPFDERRSIVPNIDGQITGKDGVVLPNEFVTGWAKRGPSGTVGTNRQDSAETVATLLKSWASSGDGPDAASTKADITEILRERNIKFTTWNDWMSIDDKELSAGRAQNRPRVKFQSLDDMMDCLD
ncbi:FAD-dependent oxidoreductase [Castellaniella sp. GW247-6E4]|uniref:FAD-dependent oxidoreductase n=1 Tax=Castellaniella sp. GW247-6E4 TaxID=3140380 RepID=UPI00331623B5